MKSLRIVFILLLALVPTALTEALQRGSASALAHNPQLSTVSGTVLDKNGARIVGATIKISNAQFSRVVLSNDEGSFNVRLPAGAYRLTADMDGFQRVLRFPFRVLSGGRRVTIKMMTKPPASTRKVG